MGSRRGVIAEDLYRFNWVKNPVISPLDGTIVYEVQKVNAKQDGYDSHLRRIQADGSEDIQWTAGQSDRSPAWSPHGKQLAFLRKSGADQHPQVWIMSAYGGEAHQVTEMADGVSSFLWSPDSQLLLIAATNKSSQPHQSTSNQSEQLPSTNPEHAEDRLVPLSKKAIEINRIIYKSDSGGLSDGGRTHLYVHKLADQSGTWITAGDYDVDDFAWSPDGKNIAYTAHIPSAEEGDPDFSRKNDLFTINIEGHERHQWTQHQYVISSLNWSPDGQSIAMVADDQSYYNATLNRLYQLSLATGTITGLCDHEDIMLLNAVVGDTGLSSTYKPIYQSNGQAIDVLCTTFGSCHLLSIATDGSGVQTILGGQRNIHYFARTAEQHLVFIAADPLQPGELFYWNAETEVETRLTHHNDDLLHELILSKPEEMTVTSVDGKHLQAWMMRPAGDQADHAKVPTILEIHGGPHAMYGYTFMLEFQLLVSQGYAVIYGNPRGSHGYGQLFVNACRHDYGGGDYQDLMEITDYALEHYDWIDKDRLGVTGGSYGGFMTNWIVGHTDRFKAAVTQRSISNWISMYGVSDIGFHFVEDQIAGNPWDHLNTLWDHSPLAYVANVKTPILILHGEKDLRCPIEQAEQWFIALKRLGAVTTFVRFPDANHELSRSGHPQLRIQRLNHIADWFNQYL